MKKHCRNLTIERFLSIDKRTLTAHLSKCSKSVQSYIALSASVSTSTTLGAAGVAGARFLDAPFLLLLLPAERRRLGVLERRDDLLREADLRFGVFDRRDRREVDLRLLEGRAERDLDRLGAFGVLERRAVLLFEDFFDDFFDDFLEDFLDDFMDDFGVRARLLREVRFEELRREREELRVDALDLDRRLGDFGVLARRALLLFEDFLDADLEVDAEEARLEPLGARARRVARLAPLRDAFLRRLPFGALGVLARRAAPRFEDFLEDFLEELLLRRFDDFGDLGDFALRRLLEEERLAFLVFSPSPLLRERFLFALIPISLLRLATISALYASRSATNFW